jgi:hypothetical protein
VVVDDHAAEFVGERAALLSGSLREGRGGDEQKDERAHLIPRQAKGVRAKDPAARGDATAVLC